MGQRESENPYRQTSREMKVKKSWIVNIAFFLCVLVLFFTPIGFKVKVMASRLLSGSAALVKEKMQVSLDTYSWELVDLDQRTFNLESQKGEVILVNFWATWCPPCVAEMPSMQELYRDYGEKVSFMFVTEDVPEKVENFLKKRDFDLPVYYPRSQQPAMLSSKLLPTTYIIYKEGKIVVAETGAADWNSPKTRKLLDALLLE